jgi:hypothetical protein
MDSKDVIIIIIIIIYLLILNMLTETRLIVPALSIPVFLLSLSLSGCRKNRPTCSCHKRLSAWSFRESRSQAAFWLKLPLLGQYRYWEIFLELYIALIKASKDFTVTVYFSTVG